ncbi:tetratricopeptide repeat-containing sensor histidine kinase [Marinifilum flexuosum]|uniref:Tetratricopeptide repeat protein n=1 Tax=Marinifilum flexuosum TaxID=1117708 RepID=A0A419X728_9BACT|nr:tetratricopeptide repeat protein [Marinifilum flexuosum]RKE03419.1 tetratricopeptide repeat protein [Marinifilum flexuosum]
MFRIFCFSFCLLFTTYISKSAYSKSSINNDALINVFQKGFKCAKKGKVDSAVLYFHKAIDEAKQVHDTVIWVKSCNNISVLRNNQGRYDQSIQAGLEILDILKEKKQNKSKLMALINVGISYYKKSDFPKALKYFIEAKDYALQFNSIIGELGTCYEEIGHVYRIIGDFKNAMIHYEKGLEVRLELRSKKAIAISYNNIGDLLLEQKKFSEALVNFEKSLKIKNEFGDKMKISLTLHNISNVEFKLGQVQNAKSNLLLAIKNRKEVNDRLGLVSSYLLLSIILIHENNFTKAEHYLLRAKELAKEIKTLDLERDIYLQLKNLYAAQNKGKEALAYYDKYISIKDSIFNTENMQHMQEMETRYQTREKEQQIEVLNIEKEAKANESFYMKIVLGVFLFSLLPIGFFVKQRQKTRILKERVAASNRECTKLGMELHDSISGNLTYLCRSMEKESVGESFVDQLRQVSDEVRGISHQLNMTAIANQEFRDALSDSLQLDHFPEDIDLKIYVPDGFEIDDYEKKINLIRIVQELKTNSLKHGNASSIVISFSRVQNKVRLAYTDNGIGFDLKEAKKGNGLINIRERVELLSGKLDWQTSPGNGVSFHLTV